MAVFICLKPLNQMAIVYLIIKVFSGYKNHTECVRMMQRQNEVDEAANFPENMAGTCTVNELQLREGFR